MKDKCFGYPLLQEIDTICDICIVSSYENKDIIMWSYEDGSCWFDSIDKSDRRYPTGGNRINKFFSYNISNKRGLQEVLTNLLVETQLKSYLQETQKQLTL